MTATPEEMPDDGETRDSCEPEVRVYFSSGLCLGSKSTARLGTVLIQPLAISS